MNLKAKMYDLGDSLIKGSLKEKSRPPVVYQEPSEMVSRYKIKRKTVFSRIKQFMREFETSETPRKEVFKHILEESKANSHLGWIDFAIEKDSLALKVLILKLYKTIEECLQELQVDYLHRCPDKENNSNILNNVKVEERHQELLNNIKQLKVKNSTLLTRQEGFLQQIAELEVECLRKKKIIDRLHSDQELFQAVSKGIKSHLEQSQTALASLTQSNSKVNEKELQPVIANYMAYFEQNLEFLEWFSRYSGTKQHTLIKDKDFLGRLEKEKETYKQIYSQ